MGAYRQCSCELRISCEEGNCSRGSDAGHVQMSGKSSLKLSSLLNVGPPAATMSAALHVKHTMLSIQGSMTVGMAQVVARLALRDEAKVSAVSPQEQPLVQLMLPAAEELAAKALGRAEVGASGLYFLFWHRL